MKKSLLIFLVLFNFNCFAVDEDIWDDRLGKEWRRLFVIAEQIEHTNNPLQRVILKVNLYTEARYIEKLIIREITIVTRGSMTKDNEYVVPLFEMLQEVQEILYNAEQ